MNAVRRQRPSIAPDDVDRLLFHLEDARSYVIKYGSAQDFNSPKKATAERVIYAVDELALQITGKNRYFWTAESSINTYDDRLFKEATAKQAKRRKLLGVNIPFMVMKFPTEA